MKKTLAFATVISLKLHICGDQRRIENRAIAVPSISDICYMSKDYIFNKRADDHNFQYYIYIYFWF